ncbi:Proline dehydrogenase family protein [Aspergillus niger]|uniref:Proline dehydrogenase family protein n=1 Tax=Aspergillus niger TaxID=5061 RepID=A0A505I3Z3_ASPNG|nr:Proline dehydrogenase family protein [Aspergillus niger]
MSPERVTTEPLHSPDWDNDWLRQLAGDIVAGSLSATIIAPITTVIDRSVVERLSSNRSILHTLRTHAICSILKPRKFYFSRPFFIAWSLYAATYATANATDTSLEHLSKVTEKSTTASLVPTFSFLPTYVVNVCLGILKDIRFSQIYGHPEGRLKQPPPIPRLAYMAFLFRDSITISSSFTLAPQVASLVPDWITADPHTKRTVTQLALPALVQYVNTPFHMIALDVIARPQTLVNYAYPRISEPSRSAVLSNQATDRPYLSTSFRGGKEQPPGITISSQEAALEGQKIKIHV